jgi:hypothetical protein
MPEPAHPGAVLGERFLINPLLQAAPKAGASLPASVTPCQGRRTAGAVTRHYAAAGLRGHAIGDACRNAD